MTHCIICADQHEHVKQPEPYARKRSEHIVSPLDNSWSPVGSIERCLAKTRCKRLWKHVERIRESGNWKSRGINNPVKKFQKTGNFGLGTGKETYRCNEACAASDGAGKHIVVASQVLCCRVQHQVGPQGQRLSHSSKHQIRKLRYECGPNYRPNCRPPGPAPVTVANTP